VFIVIRVVCEIAILSKSIAIIASDTVEISIADSNSDTSKVSPIVSLSIIDINYNPDSDVHALRNVVYFACLNTFPLEPASAAKPVQSA
jgi:hypothetical protein